MTPLLNPPQRRFLRSLFLFLVTVLNIPLHAAVRETWVQHFDGGFPDKASQPVAMQLDSQGNIFVVGSAANASNLTDYITLKYAPNGTLLWSKRYGSNNGLNNTPRALGMDTNDNLYVTGTSVTVKYSSTGDELWTAPYAGRGLALHGTNLYVTGFSEAEFATASLSVDGSLSWLQTYVWHSPGHDYSESVFVDENEIVSVVGCATEVADFRHFYRFPFLLKYDKSGNRLMATDLLSGWAVAPQPCLPLLVKGQSGNLYLLGDNLRPGINFQCFAKTADGADIWSLFGGSADGAFGKTVRAAVEDGNILYIAGAYSSDLFGVLKVKSDGSIAWRATYGARTGLANVVVLGPGNQPVLSGYLYDPFDSTKSNIITTRYDTNGMLLWANEYNGPANGADVGIAAVVDSAGNVYVAGLSTTPEGGTEIVLIKYSESATIEQSPTGTVLLQFPGTPGQPYKIQASTNLPNWLDLGLGTATTNGLLQFEDTNATKYPIRFYQTVTPTP